MAKTMILPAAFRYERELAEIAASLKAVGKDPHLDTLDILTGLVSKFEVEIKKLEKAIAHEAKGDLLSHAKHFCDEVLPAMKAVREVADDLEAIVADDYWPLPTYREMLFIK
jgi:glutamine synthetase